MTRNTNASITIAKISKQPQGPTTKGTASVAESNKTLTPKPLVTIPLSNDQVQHELVNTPDVLQLATKRVLCCRDGTEPAARVGEPVSNHLPRPELRVLADQQKDGKWWGGHAATNRIPIRFSHSSKLTTLTRSDAQLPLSEVKTSSLPPPGGASTDSRSPQLTRVGQFRAWTDSTGDASDPIRIARRNGKELKTSLKGLSAEDQQYQLSQPNPADGTE